MKSQMEKSTYQEKELAPIVTIASSQYKSIIWVSNTTIQPSKSLKFTPITNFQEKECASIWNLPLDGTVTAAVEDASVATIATS